MKNLHIIMYLSVIIGVYVLGYILLTNPNCEDKLTDERSPKLYCQYGAGYGKRVWDYESLGNNDIITDADDVFNMSICEKWSELNGKN